MRALVLALMALVVAHGTATAEDRRPKLRVLVTGDSMMQPLDRILEPHVERAGGRLISDPRPGTGLTNSVNLNWPRHAKRQVRRHRPLATVILLGPNDSYAMRGEDGREVTCCRRAWVDAYSKRVARLMRIYTRREGAHVYWLTLPTPVEPHAERFAAINIAIVEAARRVGGRTRVVDTVPAISPGNRFRRKVRYRGRRVVVRDRDGVHLTRGGSRIAGDLVRRAMGADGLLP